MAEYQKYLKKNHTTYKIIESRIYLRDSDNNRIEITN